MAWLERRSGTLDDFVFPSRIDHSTHMGTRHYARLVDERVTGIELRPEDYGTHSLRRIKASIIYKQTGNLRAVQILLGHARIESTVRYLSVDVEDALTLSERTNVLGKRGLGLEWSRLRVCAHDGCSSDLEAGLKAAIRLGDAYNKHYELVAQSRASSEIT